MDYAIAIDFITEYAHQKEITVEAELGHVGNASAESIRIKSASNYDVVSMSRNLLIHTMPSFEAHIEQNAMNCFG